MGQILGFLIIFAIIYFPFIKPLTVLSKGDIVIRTPLDETKLSKQKLFSIVITAYHFLLSLFTLILGIVKTSKLSTGYDFLVIGILGVVTTCFGVALFYLINKKDNTENLLKLGFILPIHCMIGIVCSFLLGGHLYFNLGQKILGVFIFGMLLAEVFYIIHVYRFQKKSGIIWEKPKPDIVTLSEQKKNYE